MSKIKKIAGVKKKSEAAKKAAPAIKTGRKRDPGLDDNILEAALNTLAEIGFDSMTMDQVATKANSAKTSVYRRWPSKAELVRDALISMGKKSVALDKMPDTGSLKGDLLAVAKPHSVEHSERKMKVLARLGSFYTVHQGFADEVKLGVLGPWAEMNQKIMQRAVERGEISKDADIEMACDLIISITAYRTTTLHKSFDSDFYSRLLDNILLPALKKSK